VSAGGPASAEAQAAQIAICESGGNPQAYNPSGATGLWQILGSVVAGNLTDPMVNALNAVSKFHASGDTFAQWVCQ
jgi:SLT domain-containing protein